jgi:hypothetical protein
LRRSYTFTTFGVALGTFWNAGVPQAAAYPKGIGALQVFDGGAFSAAPLAVQAWLIFMVSTFLVGLVFYAWRRPVARWAGGGFVFSLLTGHLFFASLSLPMLSGSIAIWHIVCWSPALILLLLRRPFLNQDENLWYRLWSGAMTGVILISFIFDFRDAAIYIDHFSGAG